MSRSPSESRTSQENPRGHSTVRLGARSHDRKVPDFTLPGKTSMEFAWCPYLKPTQVDKVNIHRRSRERSLRNWAHDPRNFGRKGAPVEFIARGRRSEMRSATV